MANSAKPAIHTVSHGDGWANRREGAQRVSNTANTKSEATKAGRAMRSGRRPSTLSTARTGSPEPQQLATTRDAQKADLGIPPLSGHLTQAAAWKGVHHGITAPAVLAGVQA
ncbi:MAG: DUF2188 domain-containing protein [Actinomycetota bacterium]|nr:DUF2188 domain-containing protein [Actinomycetota bacterium]